MKLTCIQPYALFKLAKVVLPTFCISVFFVVTFTSISKSGKMGMNDGLFEQKHEIIVSQQSILQKNDAERRGSLNTYSTNNRQSNPVRTIQSIETLDNRKIGTYFTWKSSVGKYWHDNSTVFVSALRDRQGDTGKHHINCEMSVDDRDIKKDGSVTRMFQKFDTTQDIYVYSAYYDNRTSKAKVRVIGMSRLINTKFYCMLLYPNGSVVALYGLAVSDRITKFEYTHRAFMYVCDLPDNSSPRAVTLVREPCTRTHVWLYVKNNMLPFKKNTSRMSPQIGLCYKTLYNLTTREHYRNIKEFIELHSILGVTRVFIYGLWYLSPSIRELIDHYVKTNRVTVYPWRLPGIVARNVKQTEYGLVANMNDCIYRHMHQYDLLAMYDTDEFIIPKNTDTWQNFFQQIRQNTSQNSGMRFQNAFFSIAKSSVHSCSNESANISLTLTHTFRQPAVQSWRKSIVFPERVVYMKVHGILVPLAEYGKEFEVDPEIAVKHHYRICTAAQRKQGNMYCRPSNIPDDTVCRYSSTLLPRLLK